MNYNNYYFFLQDISHPDKILFSGMPFFIADQDRTLKLQMLRDVDFSFLSFNGNKHRFRLMAVNKDKGKYMIVLNTLVKKLMKNKSVDDLGVVVIDEIDYETNVARKDESYVQDDLSLFLNYLDYTPDREEEEKYTHFLCNPHITVNKRKVDRCLL